MQQQRAQQLKKLNEALVVQELEGPLAGRLTPKGREGKEKKEKKQKPKSCPSALTPERPAL